MNGVKVTEKTYEWVPVVCQIIALVYNNHTFCPVSKNRPLLLQCPLFFAVGCSLYLTLRPSFIMVMNGVKVTEEAYVWAAAVCQMV
jgi:hypothetical protein